MLKDGNVVIGATNQSLAQLQINAKNGVIGQYINGGATDGIDILKLKANNFNQKLILEGVMGTVKTFLESGSSIGLFGTLTNNDFRIRTNYVDRMTFDTYGNVCIGGPVPKSKLDVKGGVRIGDDTAAASADKERVIRAWKDANGSYVDICMETSPGVYGWVNIVTNTW